jgi:hypothetical protein
MKSLRTARWIVRIRMAVGYLAIAAVSELVFQVSKPLAARIDQLSAGQATHGQAWIPSASVSEFMVVAVP